MIEAPRQWWVEVLHHEGAVGLLNIHSYTLLVSSIAFLPNIHCDDDGDLYDGGLLNIHCDCDFYTSQHNMCGRLNAQNKGIVRNSYIDDNIVHFNS